MRAHPARLIGALLLAGLVVGPTFFPTLTAQARGFTVAVLRRDGILIPFAIFDGNRWTNRWPAVHASDIPIGLTDVPKGWWAGNTAVTEWTAWLVSGQTQPIKVQAPVQVGVHCARRVGLRSDFVAIEPAPPPDFQPYPKSGLAIAGDAVVERVELLQPSSPEGKGFIEAVATSVTEAENKSVRTWSARWSHPLDETGRAKSPFTLEVLARTPGADPAGEAYYFEGVKRYPGFPQLSVQETLLMGSEKELLLKEKSTLPKMCDYITFAGGWLLTNAKREAKAMVGADLSNCNREGLAYTLPLGAIRTAGRLFWIVQVSGWEFERYDVIEIKAKEVKTVLSVGGGGCR